MERQGVAYGIIPPVESDSKSFSEIFIARECYCGEVCYLCEGAILAEDRLRYYGGPFIIHDICISRILEHL